MSIAMDAPVADERLILSRHVVPGSWLLQGGTAAGSASLAWITRVAGEAERLAAAAAGRGTFEEVSALAATAPLGSDGLVFLPYLLGERSPLWDADARGALRRPHPRHRAGTALPGRHGGCGVRPATQP